MFSTTRRAFSILELTVVLAIVSILSTMGILSYSNLHENNQARSAAQRVAATLGAARQYAIATNTPHQVFFSLKDNSFWIDELDSSLAVKRRQIENPGFLPEFMRFESLDIGGTVTTEGTAAIRFWPDGHSDSATIQLRRSRDVASNLKNHATVQLFGPTALAQVTVGGIGV